MLLLHQHTVGQRNLLGCPYVSRFLLGIPLVLFVYPFCVSHCNIYLEKKEIVINPIWWRSSRFGRFKMAVVRARARADASPKSKMVIVDASVEFKMVVIAYTFARWRPRVRFGVQCANSIIYITYLVPFSSTSLLNDFDSPDANFRQMLRYL